MKVLWLVQRYPTPASPVDGIANRERVRLSATVADVHVVHCGGPDPALRRPWRVEQAESGVLDEDIPTFRVFHRPLPRRLGYGAFVGAAIAASRSTRKLGFHPDLIHAAGYQTAVPAVLIGRARGVPVVVTEYSSGYARGLHDRVNRAKARFALKRAARVLVQSRAQQRAVERTGVRARFEVAESWVDERLFHPSPDGTERPDRPSRLLFVGLLDAAHVKGVPVIVESLRHLSGHGSGWTLDVVGDGPARPAYERQVQELGLPERVTFHGLLPKSGVAELMRRASVLVLASTTWDTAPNVLAEAQTTGLPVVATSVGGIPEMVSESEGILVPPGDARALAAAVARVLDAPAAFDRGLIAEVARTRWGLHAARTRLAEIYEAVVARR